MTRYDFARKPGPLRFTFTATQNVKSVLQSFQIMIWQERSLAKT
jgi:hypothetical protein